VDGFLRQNLRWILVTLLLAAPRLFKFEFAMRVDRRFRLTRASLRAVSFISVIRRNWLKLKLLLLDCAYGTVLFNPNTEEYDIPNYTVNNTWTLNTNDLNFGVHVVEIVGTVVDTTVGPVNSTTGETIYQYLGWYVLFHGSEPRYCSKKWC
jgi:hypothetical protein